MVDKILHKKKLMTEQCKPQYYPEWTRVLMTVCSNSHTCGNCVRHQPHKINITWTLTKEMGIRTNRTLFCCENVADITTQKYQHEEKM